MTTQSVALRGGQLHLDIERADLPLAQLCAFGTRRNPKRPFLFISKVLGRHIPVRPSVMLDTHERLAAKLGDLGGPAVVIGLAETATGLGQGVYEALLRQTGRTDLLFVPTTRYWLQQPLAFTFDESHSHATEHRVYQPHAEWRPVFAGARTLVLIDDEISTGRTLAELAVKYRALNANLEHVAFVSLLDWLPAQRRDEIAALIGLPVSFHSLLQGRFTFAPLAGFDPGKMPDVVGKGHCIDDLITGAHPRLGLCGRAALVQDPGAADALAPLAPVLRGEGTGVRGSSSVGQVSNLPLLKEWQVGNLPHGRPPRNTGGEGGKEATGFAGSCLRDSGLANEVPFGRDERVLVLGTGEFVHLPFRLALEWERRGGDVWFQAVTRSPILVGDDVASVIECSDNYGDDIPNYVYNLVANSYARVFIGYETHTIPAPHRLGTQLNATCICF